MSSAGAYPMDCRLEVAKTSECHDNDILIVIMGRTGHGKTNFLSHLGALGEGVQRVDPKSVKSSQDFHTYRLHGRYSDRLVLFDAPGFDAHDGVTRSLYGILKETKKIVEKTYGPNKKLAGIVYLYAFNDQHNSALVKAPLKESPLANEFYMMGSLCGTPDRVWFVSWVWDSDDPQTDVVQAFTETRKQITRDAYFTTFSGSSDSAWEIISSVVNKPQVSTQTSLPQEKHPAAHSLVSRIGGGIKKVFCFAAEIKPGRRFSVA